MTQPVDCSIMSPLLSLVVLTQLFTTNLFIAMSVYYGRYLPLKKNHYLLYVKDD